MLLANLWKLTIFYSSQPVACSVSFYLLPCVVIYCVRFLSYFFLMDVDSRSSVGFRFYFKAVQNTFGFLKAIQLLSLVHGTVVQGMPQLPANILVYYNPESVLFEITSKQSRSGVSTLPLIFPFAFTVAISHQKLFPSCLLGLFLVLPPETFWKLSFSIPKSEVP